MDEFDSNRMRWILAVALASIIVGGVTDMILDQPQPWLGFHMIFEALMLTGALLMATTLWLGWWQSTRSVRVLQKTLERQQAERDAWRESARHALDGLGEAIDRQFDGWQLTPAERDVALLLLKGHSHKAIARRTDRGDQTVRQHATAVYRKAGLRGRAELSAFFLEDLMLPEESRKHARVTGQA